MRRSLHHAQEFAVEWKPSRDEDTQLDAGADPSLCHHGLRAIEASITLSQELRRPYLHPPEAEEPDTDRRPSGMWCSSRAWILTTLLVRLRETCGRRKPEPELSRPCGTRASRSRRAPYRSSRESIQRDFLSPLPSRSLGWGCRCYRSRRPSSDPPGDQGTVSLRDHGLCVDAVEGGSLAPWRSRGFLAVGSPVQGYECPEDDP